MNMNLKLLLWTLGLSLLARAGVTAEHPSIFFKSSELAALRARTTQPFYADAWGKIRGNVKYVFDEKPNTSGDPRRQWTRGLRAHAAMWLLDPTTVQNDSRYQSDTLFFDYFYRILNDDGWSDLFGSPVDSGYFLIALVTAYDWQYDKFTSTQRADISARLTSICETMMNDDFYLDVPSDLYNPGSYYLHEFKMLRNKFVCQFSALGFAAYGLKGEVDESKRQAWENKANDRLEIWATYFMNDGVSAESFSYHQLESQCLLQFLELKSERTGINEFLKYPEIIEFPVYSIYSWVPGGDRNFLCSLPFGEGDAAPPAELRVMDGLIAKRLKPLGDFRAPLANWMHYSPEGGPRNNNYGRSEALQFFLEDSSVDMKSPAELGMPNWHFFAESEQFVWRSSWDPMAMYFATIGGRQWGGHMLPEKGNFLIFKGGAPFVASHFYMNKVRSRDFNVMLIDGKGQLGEATDSDTSKPQPREKRAFMRSVLADNQYFNVLTDLKSIYDSTKLQIYTREYVGWDNLIVVRDAVKTNASASFEWLQHAYRTKHPIIEDYTALDPDSDKTANPWGGSGTNRTITPRPAGEGPFTGTMTVRDVSLESWTGTISDDIPSLQNGDYRRGSKLSRVRTDTDTSSVMAYGFLSSGQSIDAMTSAMGAEGFRLNGPNGVEVIVGWPTNGLMLDAYGLEVGGSMGGYKPREQSGFIRDGNVMKYIARTYISADQRISARYSISNNELNATVIVPTTTVVRLDCPMVVRTVYLNGQILASDQWSLGDSLLRINMNGAPETRTIRAVTTLDPGSRNAANSAWLLAQ